jgi:uncharacterized membrane protein YjjP (DUF1212 family)
LALLVKDAPTEEALFLSACFAALLAGFVGALSAGKDTDCKPLEVSGSIADTFCYYVQRKENR